MQKAYEKLAKHKTIAKIETEIKDAQNFLYDTEDYYKKLQQGNSPTEFSSERF